MNDFFAPENEAPSALSADEEKEIRAKIQADVFDGTPAKFEDLEEKEIVSDDKIELEDEDESKVVLDESSEPEPEPAVELSPEMQKIVDSLNKLTSSLSGMEDRIKQTERRVGGISNEFYAAKDAAKDAATLQAKAPTPEAMAEAAKNEKAWEELKKDFPSWADAIDSKLKTQTSKFVSVDDFEALRANVSKMPTVDSQQLEARLVGLIHPDWKQITQDPEYASWLNVQPADVKQKAYQGTTAEEAIDVFSRYKTHKTSIETSANGDSLSEVKQIQAQRKERLKSSTTTNTKHKTIKQKSPDDMSEAELREHIASKVFAK